MAGNILDKAYVIGRFNTIVVNGLSPARDTATWHSSNEPSSLSGNLAPLDPLIKFDPLGPQTEGVKSVSDLPPEDLAASVVFSILHRFAMEYTRVRNAEVWYRTPNDTTATMGSTALTAFRTDLALTITIPSYPAIGSIVSATDLDNFLTTLRDRVNAVRSGNAYTSAILSCHSSCHSSCHGSRGRR